MAAWAGAGVFGQDVLRVRTLEVAIVGNGPAAAEAISALRGAGYCGAIHLFADNTNAPYNPVLGTYYAAGRVPRTRCFPFGVGRAFYRSLGVTAHLGDPVVALHPFERTLHTGSGRTYHYERCLVATGARCVVPRLPGIEGPRVLRMRTFAHALRLRQALAAGVRSAVVVGASFVGVRVLDALREAGCRVTLVDAAPQILPGTAHPECSALLVESLERSGVDVRVSACLKGIEERGDGVAVWTERGATPLQADIAVLCLGVTPNVDLLAADPDLRTGDLLDRGVLVEQSMAAVAPGLFAAGDVAQAANLLTGRPEIVPLYANARQQGRVAGRSMAGKRSSYAGSVPHNITRVSDQVLFSIGDVGKARRQVTWKRDSRFLYLGFTDGRLCEANGLGCSGLAGPLLAEVLVQCRRDDVAGRRGSELAARAAGVRLASLEQAWPRLGTVLKEQGDCERA
jgi:NADPH-dependent 2,4-dienoyl-CoA reductase/sulfur reductase-like enzyme